MRKINNTRPGFQIGPYPYDSGIKTDSRGEKFMIYPNGQIRRLSSDGVSLPRIRLSKKERRKLRKEYRDVQNLEPSELADKILETPVINPTAKADPDPELKLNEVAEKIIQELDQAEESEGMDKTMARATAKALSDDFN